MILIKKQLIQLNVMVAMALMSVCLYANATLHGDQILSATKWQGVRAYLEDNTDVSKENANYLGLAHYDEATNRYEFFDAKTGKTRGDMGIYFVTQDNMKRINISQTFKYQAIVDLITLKSDLFTYKRKGKDRQSKDVDVFVEHVPYKGGYKLHFTKPQEKYTHKTGLIVSVKKEQGRNILSDTKWRGLVALDEKGNDVSQYNANYLGLAHYDAKTNRYEFFKVDGVSRGDYGFYDVIDHNKVRVNVSQSFKYAAILELTELNNKKFSYRRKGKNAEGKEIWITVVHVPYTGDLPLNFTH